MWNNFIWNRNQNFFILYLNHQLSDINRYLHRQAILYVRGCIAVHSLCHVMNIYNTSFQVTVYLHTFLFRQIFRSLGYLYENFLLKWTTFQTYCNDTMKYKTRSVLLLGQPLVYMSSYKLHCIVVYYFALCTEMRCNLEFAYFIINLRKYITAPIRSTEISPN